ncbi:hypothetical protein GCM10020000_43250 [Streptomyces olivoverticillatus]
MVSVSREGALGPRRAVPGRIVKAWARLPGPPRPGVGRGARNGGTAGWGAPWLPWGVRVRCLAGPGSTAVRGLGPGPLPPGPLPQMFRFRRP